MSKINTLRLINLNYNNDSIKISDEIFHMNGESTLLSLRNGGGKTVLVQMMMAPFVNRRYRNLKERLFESYFKTNKPTFIMVEWLLDQGAGYVTTGMMVRKSQEISEENVDNLEIINFVSEYQDRCEHDIFNIPVIEKTKKEIKLKSFSVCRQLFDSYKKDRACKFNYYDMNNSSLTRQYFEKLKEYQINYKEWETIIRKVNLKESGLYELFSDCKDEKGLVEKWFLTTVESKLNKEKDRIKEFQNIIEKYVGTYKANKTSIDRRNTINLFNKDALSVLDKAKEYEQTLEDELHNKNVIINFLEILTLLEQTTTNDKEEAIEKITQIEKDISNIEYEKISNEIYKLKKEELYHSGNREMIGMEKNSIENECESIRRSLSILRCAKQQLLVNENIEKYNYVNEKLKLCQIEAKDLEPERISMGSKLKKYYTNALELEKDKENKLRQNIKSTNENIKAENTKIEKYSNDILELTKEIAFVESKIKSFDEREDRFNKSYSETFSRNILGEYEPGLQQIKLKQYKGQLEELKRDHLNHNTDFQNLLQNKKSLQRQCEDSKNEKNNQESLKRQNILTKERYDNELSQRKIILKYLELSEEHIFFTSKIVEAAERKIAEIERIKRGLEKEEDILQKEYAKLTSGKILELQSEFEDMLQNLGINYVYGMEWIKRNGFSAEKNKDIVNSHPFLPYSIIMSQKEMEKLENSDENIYSSIPIPIIIRESLEDLNQNKISSVLHLKDEQIHFYVWFNKNLLDEEKLQLMLYEKSQQIDKKEEAIDIRKKELDEYIERKEKIKNQEVNKDNYDRACSLIKEYQKNIDSLVNKIKSINDDIVKIQQAQKQMTKRIQEQKEEIWYQEKRLEDYQIFSIDYDKYLEQLEKAARKNKEKTRAQEKLKLATNSLLKLQDMLKTLDSQRDGAEKNILKFHEKLLIFDSYNIEETESVTLELALQLEARYQAVTSKLSYEQTELEEQLQMAGKSLERSKEELFDIAQKYKIFKEEWENVVYQKKEESYKEQTLEDREQKLKIKDSQWNEEDKKAAILGDKIQERKNKMREQFNKDEPLLESEIKTKDFNAKINELNYDKYKTNELIQKLNEKIKSFGENITALAEYSDFKKESDVLSDVNFYDMKPKELRDFKGKLIRDYHGSIASKQSRKEEVERILNELLNKPEYEDDFYKKPLKNMISLVDNAKQVISQINVTVSSYENQMEKLDIDIAMIEQEKTRIVEILADYVNDIHTNLLKIDRNSTITIRKRPVKMLKIKLPDWEENESLYTVRIKDFIDELTKKGVEIFERNENAHEYFGREVTARNVYNTVVGIGNVEIKLYKIEEQREVAITWSEVAKNSGGEGFLSAFIILSSLLYYMRKDESDIFAERNEGKVLVMDNPFAQTNAAHLLKPLMDMAKKTNTQLICLSGLGGESIYNRFDNIYILNLVAASLKNDRQYLKAEHTKGIETQTMAISRIEVVDQMELLF